jgi:hypothetical protein
MKRSPHCSGCTSSYSSSWPWRDCARSTCSASDDKARWGVRFFHNRQVQLPLSCGSYCFAIRASQTPPSAPPTLLPPGVSCLAHASGIFLPSPSRVSSRARQALFHLIPPPSPPITPPPHSLPPSVLQPCRRRTFIHHPSSNTAASSSILLLQHSSHPPHPHSSTLPQPRRCNLLRIWQKPHRQQDAPAVGRICLFLLPRCTFSFSTSFRFVLDFL